MQSKKQSVDFQRTAFSEGFLNDHRQWRIVFVLVPMEIAGARGGGAFFIPVAKFTGNIFTAFAGKFLYGTVWAGGHALMKQFVAGMTGRGFRQRLSSE